MATILVVEDDDNLRWCLKEIFNRTPYCALFAASGKEAVTLCGKLGGAIHLLIAEVAMPNMSGVKLAGILRARYPSLAILFISVYPATTLSEYDEVPPDRTFLQKPFLGQDLLVKVAEILRPS